MAKILIATVPLVGHIAPFSPIARELVQRGHEVLWYGSRFFKDRIEATGAHFAPIQHAVDFGDSDYNHHWPERAALKGMAQVKFDFITLFIGSMEGQFRDLSDVFDQFKADVILHDSTCAAAIWLSMAQKVPSAMLNVTVNHFPSRDLAPFGMGVLPSSSPAGRLRNRVIDFIGNRIVMRPVNNAYREIARRRKLPIQLFRPTPSAYLTLQPSVPELEYRLSDSVPTLHYIGALLPYSKTFEPPSWWPAITHKDKPLVLVTQGTVATASEQLVQPTLAALADEPVQVLATTGGKPLAELGWKIPSNAGVETFIPFVPLMPYVDIYVTNGGFGGVMIALANGVPIIGAGNSEDKAEVNNRLQYSGVGINLKTPTPTVEQVRTAVRTLLNEPGYRQAAQRVQAALAKHDAPGEAADLLERLIATRQPILAV